MPVMNVAKFERFFRLAASLDVDKGDLRRYNDFLDQKIYDLLLIGQAHAKTNDHPLIWPSDLPVTKGLQENIHDFRDIDEQIELTPILEGLTKHPPMDLDYNDQTKAELPQIAGGMSVALARSFRVLVPGLKNPTYPDWDRAFQAFNLLL
jgi:hypothetical protein